MLNCKWVYSQYLTLKADLLPSKEEIKEALAFSEELFEKVCDILKIDTKEIRV